MTHFLAKYASYYDFIYAEKDYAQEAAYVDALIKKYYGNAQAFLNLGVVLVVMRRNLLKKATLCMALI